MLRMPVSIVSPRALRAVWLSWRRSASATSTPSAAARAAVSPSAIAPATFVGPSEPSESADPTTTRGLPAMRATVDRTNSSLRPPIPGSSPVATTNSPPHISTWGAGRGLSRVSISWAMWASTSPAACASMSFRLEASTVAGTPISAALARAASSITSGPMTRK